MASKDDEIARVCADLDDLLRVLRHNVQALTAIVDPPPPGDAPRIAGPPDDAPGDGKELAVP